MKNKQLPLCALLISAAGLMASCGQQASKTETTAAVATDTVINWKDYGKEPLVLDIEKYTLANENFRTTLWTGANLQVTLMTIPVGGEIGLEQHPNIDQFLRIEDGEAKVMMGDSRENLDFVQQAGADYAVFVPAGKWHNLLNTGDKPLKLYSIYAPVEHPFGTVHKTKADADAMEAAHHD